MTDLFINRTSFSIQQRRKNKAHGWSSFMKRQVKKTKSIHDFTRIVYIQEKSSRTQETNSQELFIFSKRVHENNGTVYHLNDSFSMSSKITNEDIKLCQQFLALACRLGGSTRRIHEAGLVRG